MPSKFEFANIKTNSFTASKEAKNI